MLAPNEQLKIILKGVHQCVNVEELLEKLKISYKQNKPLVIKLGLVPSAPDIEDDLNQTLVTSDVIKIGKKRFVRIEKSQ